MMGWIRNLKRRIRRLKWRLSDSWIGRLVIGGWQQITNLPNLTAFWLALVGTILLGGIVGIVFGGWDWLRETELNSLPESRSTTIRNAGLVIAGALALVFAVWRGVLSQRQAETAQQGLLNERYQKGAEMLGSEVLSVRLGGIYALQRLAAEHPEQYHLQIMQLFCAFVRNPTGKAEGQVWSYDKDGEPIRWLRDDVQAVMSAIGSRTDGGIALERADERFLLNLQNIDLQRGVLEELHLSGAFFIRANLSGAYLGDTDLSGADFDYADLSGALLPDSGLSGVSFGYANLSNARFSGANLFDARLHGANLSRARLFGANLTGASLTEAILTGASFSIRGRGGNPRHPATGLTQAQLDKARSDPDNPPYLEGVLDAETGEQLVWRGKPLEDDPIEPDAVD